MSASITHKDQQPSECGKQRHCGEDMSFNHETGEMKGYTPPEKSGCHCNENPYKEQYEKLIAEAKAARDEFLQKAKDLEDIAKETKATANKDAIIAAVNSAQPDLSAVAKEAQATLNKQEVIQKISKILGLPCVEVVHPEDEYKTVFIRNISVNLLQRCIVQAGVLGVNDRIKFRIAHRDGDAMLYTTSDSYAPLANTYLGNYDDGEIIDEISFDIDTPCDPSVYIDGIKLNGLFDNEWRLSQIQNTLIGVDTGIGEVKQAIQDIDVADVKEALIHALMQTSNIYATNIINCIAIDWTPDGIKNYYIVGKETVNNVTYYKWVTADALPLEYVYTTKWKDLNPYGTDHYFQLVNGAMVESQRPILSAHHINTATDRLINALQRDATLNKQAVMGDITPFNTGESIPACYFEDQPWDIDSEETIMEQSQMTMPDNFGVGSVVTAGDFDSEIFYVASKVGTLSISYDGQDYIVSGVTEWLKVAANKAYRCVDVKTVTFEDRFGDTITGYIYVYEEYDPTGKSIKQVYEKLDQISPEDPNSKAVAEFFGLPSALPEYTALTPAEAIAIARDCQYNVMGTDWPIPTWLPTGVTEAQVESAAEGLGIPYHEPTQTA